jgi:hypothetical protein
MKTLFLLLNSALSLLLIPTALFALPVNYNASGNWSGQVVIDDAYVATSDACHTGACGTITYYVSDFNISKGTETFEGESGYFKYDWWYDISTEEIYFDHTHHGLELNGTGTYKTIGWDSVTFAGLSYDVTDGLSASLLSEIWINDANGIILADGTWLDWAPDYSMTLHRTNPVPEPSTLLLAGLGIAGVLSNKRRKKNDAPSSFGKIQSLMNS